MRKNRVIVPLLAIALLVAAIGSGQTLHAQTGPVSTETATPSGPPASPWPLEMVRSVNTDPRIGWVIVVGPEEGHENVVICSNRNLVKGTIDPEDGLVWEVIDEASMCLPGDTTQQATAQTDSTDLWADGRTINTDPKTGWAIITGPMGDEAAVICNGSTAIANSLTRGGEVESAAYPRMLMCASAPIL